MPAGNVLPPKKYATIVVATNNPSGATIGPVQADYWCDGTNDEVQLQAAITAGAGKKILILDGAYNKAVSAGITVASNTEVEIIAGATINQTKVDASCSVFKNSDQTNGNVGIHIHGDGVLNGNRNLASAATDQYAFDFVKVTKSLVDINIDNFRTLEARLRESGCVIKNRRYENMSKNEETLIYFNSTEQAAWTYNGRSGAWSISATGGVNGNPCLQCDLNKAENLTVLDSRWLTAGTTLDMRYKAFSVNVKITGWDSRSQLESAPQGIVRLFLYDTSGSAVIINSPANMAEEWIRIILYTDNIDADSYLAYRIDRIYRIGINCYVPNTAYYPASVTVLIDDLKVVPMKSPCGAVAFSADDGHASWPTIETILSGYGYRGNYNIATDYTYDAPGGTYTTLKETFRTLLLNGAEIASHSCKHNVQNYNLWQEIIESKSLLQRDSMGDIRFMAIPGGTSKWTGELLAKVPEVYTAYRMTCSAAISKGETVPVFSLINIGLSLSFDLIKTRLSWKINNRENIALYFHRLDDVECSTARLIEVCDWLYDKGIPVVTYSEMFPPTIRRDPDWLMARSRHLVGQVTKTYKTGACLALDNDYVLAATALTSAAQEITVGITNPDIYRVILVKGNQAGMTGSVVVEGTNWAGEFRRDAMTLIGSNIIQGECPFKTVTKVILPVKTNDGDTVSVGICDKLGIPDTILSTGDVIEQARKAAAATEYTIEAVGTVDVYFTRRTVNVAATSVIVDGDSFEFTYRVAAI